MRARCRWWWVVPLFAVVVLAHRDARGEPADADPDTEIARRHFDEGSRLYTAGRYAEAIEEFEAARKTKPLPAFDFNIGRCLDRLEHPGEAIAAYERYLAGEPNAPDSAEVRQRIATLRGRLPGEAPAVSAAEVRPRRRRVATWAVGGVGAALLVSSLASGLVAHSRYGDLKTNCAADGACNAATVPNAQSWIDSGKAAGLASDVLLGLGLATVATGVVLFFVEGRHPTEHHTSRIVPTVGVRGGGLTFEVSP